MIDVFKKEDYDNINLDYPSGYLELLYDDAIKQLERDKEYIVELKGEVDTFRTIAINEAKRANKLQKEYYELREIIDKATEYNNEVLKWTTNEPLTDEIANTNIKILKGDSNE